MALTIPIFIIFFQMFRSIKNDMFDEIALKLGSQSEFKTIFNELDEAIFIFEDKKLQNMNIISF